MLGWVNYRVAVVALLVLMLGSTLSAAAPVTLRPAQQGQQAPQIASYRMEVRLDPTAKTVAGSERITYQNPSQDTLDEIWLRLYLRAFSSQNTTWMRESGGQLRGFEATADNLGDIAVSSLATAGGADLLASATMTDTLMRVPLPQPLGPGERLELDVEWVSKLPRVFARTGYGGRDDTFFMVGQWYPKMAVYDRGRWDTEPWHANSEFFHDFGSYDVSITAPQDYVLAGAGVPAGEQANSDGTRTLRFTAENVTDFAFAASPDFQTRTTTAGEVEVALFYLPEHETAIEEYLSSATGSLEAFSQWYGPYPHPRLTVVDVPNDAAGAGGMEYPTLVTGGTLGAPGTSGIVAMVVSHEVGHQWWPMQTATNEGREPWLDEGLTEYSGIRYLAEVGQSVGSGTFAGLPIGAELYEKAIYQSSADHPATLPAWEYSPADYITVYSKTAMGLWTLENVVGTERFRRAMADYLAAFRFKHPTSADFRASLEGSLGDDLGWFFDDFMSGTGLIDYAAGAIEGDGVRVAREGEVPAPVDVRITLASGAQQDQTWDGQGASTSFATPPGDPAVRVEVDPARKLKAELDRLDNAVGSGAQLGPALTFGGRLAFWLQAAVQSLGLFG
jgi:hypothetical protein